MPSRRSCPAHKEAILPAPCGCFVALPHGEAKGNRFIVRWTHLTLEHHSMTGTANHVFDSQPQVTLGLISLLSPVFTIFLFLLVDGVTWGYSLALSDRASPPCVSLLQFLFLIFSCLIMPWLFVASTLSVSRLLSHIFYSIFLVVSLVCDFSQLPDHALALRSFQTYWDSEHPRIGETGSLTWRGWMRALNTDHALPPPVPSMISTGAEGGPKPPPRASFFFLLLLLVCISAGSFGREVFSLHLAAASRHRPGHALLRGRS